MSDVPAHSDQPSAQLHTWDFRGCLDRIDTQKPFASSVALLNRGLWRIRKQGGRSSSARRWWSCGKECCGRRSSHSRRSRDSNSISNLLSGISSTVEWISTNTWITESQTTRRPLLYFKTSYTTSTTYVTWRVGRIMVPFREGLFTSSIWTFLLAE